MAIFAPPALLMVTASLALDHFKGSRGLRAAMRGIRCGVIGMLAVASWVIFAAAIPPELASPAQLIAPCGIALAALVALERFRLDVVWVIPVAGLVGYAVYG